MGVILWVKSIDLEGGEKLEEFSAGLWGVGIFDWDVVALDDAALVVHHAFEDEMGDLGELIFEGGGADLFFVLDLDDGGEVLRRGAQGNRFDPFLFFCGEFPEDFSGFSSVFEFAKRHLVRGTESF